MKVGKITSINVDDLSFGCRSEVLVKCDICENEKNIKFQKYIKNLKTNEGYEFYCCSKKCANEKRKLTTLKKYGVENISQTDHNKEKVKDAFLKKYGFEHAFHSPEVKEKIKKTNIDRYGFENAAQSPLIQSKMRETSLKKFGVEHNMQNEELFNKNQISGKRLKIHEKSGLTYRGTYEKDFLDLYHTKLSIKNIGGITYFFNSKTKKYFPDFYIPELNLIVEIKNSYLYNKNLAQNLAKQRACLELGFNYVFIIDKNYEEFEGLVC